MTSRLKNRAPDLSNSMAARNGSTIGIGSSPLRPTRADRVAWLRRLAISGLVKSAFVLEKRHMHRAAERAFRTALKISPLGSDPDGVIFVKGYNLPGWLKQGPLEGAPIVIKLNERPIAETLADAKVVFAGTSSSDARYVPFCTSVQGMWPYLGQGDVVEVEIGGTPVPLIDGSYGVSGPTSRRSRSDELLAKLADGYVFAKGGKFIRSLALDHQWQRRAVSHMERISRLVSESFGYKVFATYGVMLGAVREGNMIGHDTDFDMTYVSRYSERNLVVGEFLEICRSLRENGFSVSNSRKREAKVLAPDGTKLDLFYSWFAPDDTYRISYGYHGRPARRSERFHRFEKRRLGAVEIDVPENAEEQLSQFYGDDWRTPNPGFSHSRRTLKVERTYSVGRLEALRGRPPAAIRERLRWDRYYSGHVFENESTFADFTDKRFADKMRLVELGCGEGRDAIFFARRGHSVIGVDRSVAGIEIARKKANRVGESVEFLVGDLSDPAVMRDVLAKAVAGRTDESTPLVVYMRFFLHAIPLADETVILDAIAGGTSPDCYVVAEFRTDLDGGRFKAEGNHYRRFIPPAELKKRLVERGFSILHEEAGFGLSVYGREDPHLGRIIAKRIGTMPRPA